MTDQVDRLDAIQRTLDVRISPGPQDIHFLLNLSRKQQAAIDAVTKLVDERYRLWAAICGNTCSKDITGVDHDAIADEVANSIHEAIRGSAGGQAVSTDPETIRESQARQQEALLAPEVEYTAERQDAFWAKVEKTEACWDWTATKTSRGYGNFWSVGKMHQAHRVAYELVKGPIPEGLFIDHMCHNKGCVNPEHLRVATAKQNQENVRGARADSTSGVRGVSWSKGKSKWHAHVRHGGKVIHAGYFTDKTEAEEASKALRNKLFTHNDVDRRDAPEYELADDYERNDHQ